MPPTSTVTVLEPSLRPCPYLANLDPATPENVADPFPWLKRARETCPVFYIASQDLWCVTRYHDALDVLRDPITFSSLHAHDLRVPMPREIAAEVGNDYVWPLTSQLSVIDPPQHTRLRKLIQPEFTPKRIGRFEPELRDIAETLIDGFADAGSIDLVSTFTRRLPALFIAKVIGSPLDEADQFHQWVPHLFQLTGRTQLPDDESLEAWRNVIAWERYTRTFVERRRAGLGDDLTSDLIRAGADDGVPALTDQEILANVIGFIGAGADNSSTLIAQTLYLLLTHEDQWAMVKEDPSLLQQAIEETMRFRGPATSVRRRTTKEIDLGGIHLSEGVDVWVHLLSANRDEAVFPDPERFDILRKNVNKHLAWGIWTHFCVGAPLARLEARVALEALIARFPRLRLAPGQDRLDSLVNIDQPGITSLRLELE